MIEEIIGIAKRENNTKRKYLVVNRLQGKYMPVSPKRTFAMFRELAELLAARYDKERLLVIGFAETATAIGAAVAVRLKADYMQTTREQVSGVQYLHFLETHSHAPEQKLIKNDLDSRIANIDRIIFVEDEVTTGNTILNSIASLEKEYGSRISFSVASLINGMEEAALHRYREKGILLHYLIKTDHSSYEKIAEKCHCDGYYYVKNTDVPKYPCNSLTAKGCQNARRLVNGEKYENACKRLWQQVQEQICFLPNQKVLVLGTEEFMYPALYVAGKIEETGCTVSFHATGRSPIEVSSEPDYPLHTRYELESLYERERRIFLYDIGTYDKVFVLTDAARSGTEGEYSLRNALEACKNKDITLIRWEE